ATSHRQSERAREQGKRRVESVTEHHDVSVPFSSTRRKAPSLGGSTSDTLSACCSPSVPRAGSASGFRAISVSSANTRELLALLVVRVYSTCTGPSPVVPPRRQASSRSTA